MSISEAGSFARELVYKTTQNLIGISPRRVLESKPVITTDSKFLCLFSMPSCQVKIERQSLAKNDLLTDLFGLSEINTRKVTFNEAECGGCDGNRSCKTILLLSAILFLELKKRYLSEYKLIATRMEQMATIDEDHKMLNLHGSVEGNNGVLFWRQDILCSQNLIDISSNLSRGTSDQNPSLLRTG
jgi:hypothetical protein